MHGAPCPIAIVPPGWEAGGGLNTIGVAYVDSDEGREALSGGTRWRAARGPRCASSPRSRPGSPCTARPRRAPPSGPAGLRRGRGRAARAGGAALRQATDALDGDVPVETDAFVEDPADVLIRVSEHLDLLVCGSRGYGPCARCCSAACRAA